MQFTLKQLLLVTAIASLAGAGHCEVAIFALLLAVFSLIMWRLIRRKNQPRRYHKAAFELLLLAIVSSLILPTITRSAIWDGRATVSLMFVLTERETGNPIPGARLEIGHIPTEPLNASALRVEAQATSDSQGQATINVTLPASGRDSLCKRTGRAFFFPDHWMRVTAPKLASTAHALCEFTGDEYDLRLRPPIEPITIELRRTSKASQARQAK